MPGRARPGCGVDHLGQLPPWPAGGGPGRGGSRRGGPAQGDDADDAAVVGDRERLVDVLVALRRHAEEQATQALVDRGQQHQQRRHAGVDVPVRHRPAGLVHVGPALVRLGVAAQVGPLVGAAQHQHRGAAHALQPGVRLVVGVGGRRPERRALRRLAEHDEVPALAEAGAGRPGGVAQDRLQALGRDQVVGVVAAHHPAGSDDVGELHGPHSPTGAGSASPRWLTGSRTPRTRGRWHGP